MPEIVPATEQPAPEVTDAAAVENPPAGEAPAEKPAAPAEPAAKEPTAAEKAAADKQAKADAKAEREAAIADAKTAQAKEIAKLLGLPGFEDKEVDPAKLAESLKTERDTIAAERDAERNKLRQYELRDVVRSSADKKADVDGLYDSASFLAEIKDIDPSDKKAAALIATAIDAAIARRPSLALADPNASTTSSAEVTGDGKPAGVPDSVDAFRAQSRADRGDSRF